MSDAVGMPNIRHAELKVSKVSSSQSHCMLQSFRQCCSLARN